MPPAELACCRRKRAKGREESRPIKTRLDGRRSVSISRWGRRLFGRASRTVYDEARRKFLEKSRRKNRGVRTRLSQGNCCGHRGYFKKKQNSNQFAKDAVVAGNSLSLYFFWDNLLVRRKKKKMTPPESVP